MKTVKTKLAAVFDASGKEDTPCLVVAGFISSPDDWNKFDDEWTARLKQDGLQSFHMKDFAHSKNQFVGWRDEENRRQQLFGDLIDIISRNVFRQAACAIDMTNFFKGVSLENRKQASLNAYVLAARTCAADFRRWQQRENFVVPTLYIFEEGDEGVGMLSTRLTEDAFSAPEFKPKAPYEKDGIRHDAFTPFQAADILAYELLKPYRDLIEGKGPIEKFRFGFEALSKIPGIAGHYSPENFEILNHMLTAQHE